MRYGSSTISWPISKDDFLLMQVDSNTCVGGFFALDTSGTSAPAWIVGDTFLKNVYSVYRATPPSVGFAQLSNTALAMNGQLGPAPSPTIGRVSATVTGTAAGTGSDRNSGVNAANRMGSAANSVWLALALSAVLGGNLLL